MAACWITALLLSSGITRTQAPARGTIAGTVTVDQGLVRGFRVAAHNLRQMIWYVVFTKDGRYTVPHALPGPYEINVLQNGFQNQPSTAFAEGIPAMWAKRFGPPSRV